MKVNSDSSVGLRPESVLVIRVRFAVTVPPIPLEQVFHSDPAI